MGWLSGERDVNLEEGFCTAPPPPPPHGAMVGRSSERAGGSRRVLAEDGDVSSLCRHCGPDRRNNTSPLVHLLRSLAAEVGESEQLSSPRVASETALIS